MYYYRKLALRYISEVAGRICQSRWRPDVCLGSHGIQDPRHSGSPCAFIQRSNRNKQTHSPTYRSKVSATQNWVAYSVGGHDVCTREREVVTQSRNFTTGAGTGQESGRGEPRSVKPVVISQTAAAEIPLHVYSRQYGNPPGAECALQSPSFRDISGVSIAFYFLFFFRCPLTGSNCCIFNHTFN